MCRQRPSSAFRHLAVLCLCLHILPAKHFFGGLIKEPFFWLWECENATAADKFLSFSRALDSTAVEKTEEEGEENDEKGGEKVREKIKQK